MHGQSDFIFLVCFRAQFIVELYCCVQSSPIEENAELSKDTCRLLRPERHNDSIKTLVCNKQCALLNI